MKILLLGAKGMLGKDLAPLLAMKYPVVLMDIEDLDICSQQAVADGIRNIRPDVVINAAAYTDVDRSELDPQKAFSVNAEGAQNVALACAAKGAHLVHLSTDYVFDGSLSRPYREEDLPNPLNAYGASKLKGERLIQEALKNFLVIRTAWLYGRHGRNFVKAILDQAALKKEIRVVNDQRGAPTFTKDLGRAILRLVEAGAKGIVHVTNAESCTWLEFAREILKEKSLNDVVLRPISSFELSRPARRPANSVLDCSLYESLTGQRLRPWREALREYLFE